MIVIKNDFQKAYINDNAIAYIHLKDTYPRYETEDGIPTESIIGLIGGEKIEVRTDSLPHFIIGQLTKTEEQK